MSPDNRKGGVVIHRALGQVRLPTQEIAFHRMRADGPQDTPPHSEQTDI